MNPSARGWIKKLLKALEGINALDRIHIDEYYDALRDCGFIYGNNAKVIIQSFRKFDLTEEERCKVNLVIAFLAVYNNEKTSKPFIESVNDFYSTVTEHKTSIFDEILGGKIASTTLEKLIHKRIQIEQNQLTKNFNYFLINALLFVDILGYQRYLRQQYITEAYFIRLEAAIETIVINLIESKANKSNYDLSLIKLLEASLRYQNIEKLSYNKAVALIETPLEAKYIMDMACMSTWTDRKIDIQEIGFLSQLGQDLKMDKSIILSAMHSVEEFYANHSDDLTLLNSKNALENFYDNSSKMVSTLIKRNSRRLQLELSESKELMKLISQSTVRDLDRDEQNQLQKQLLDIFKTIPSLAIFMLPGGALLLPLVIKFIPKLLPSAFDDNRIEDS